MQVQQSIQKSKLEPDQNLTWVWGAQVNFQKKPNQILKGPEDNQTWSK